MLFVIIFYGNYFFSQKTLNFSFEKITETTINTEEEISFIHGNNDLVLFYHNYVKDKLNIYNIESELVYTIDSERINNKNIKSICFFDNRLLINVFHESFVFNLINSEFVFNKGINHEYETGLFLDSNNILFYRNYNYHPNDKTKSERSELAIYDFTLDTFKSKKSIDFNYIYYTHLISKFISVSPNSKTIAVAQTIPYKINFYNNNLEVIDSISVKSDNDYSKLEEITKINTFSNGGVKQVIYELSKVDKKIDRVIKTYFLNDTCLLVIKKMSKTNNNDNERNIDVWNYSNGKWDLIVKDKEYYSMFSELKGLKVVLKVPFAQSEKLLFKNNKIYTNGIYIPFNEKNTIIKIRKYLNNKDPESTNKGIYEYNYEIQ